MVCKFKSRLYINPGNGYTVAEYSSMELDCIPSEAVISNYGTEVTFTAFGKELPCMDNVEIEMEGDWKRSEKYGLQFGVDWSRVLLPKSREGIIGYLSSELITGIGPVMAREIVNRFGTDTFTVMENHPNELLAIKGITEQKLEFIIESYQKSAELRELMAYLAPYHVTPKKAEKIKQHFGLEAVTLLKENPYRLCEIKGFGFITVDSIARASKDLAPDEPERIKAAIQYVLRKGAEEGNLYLDSTIIVDMAYKVLNAGFPTDTVRRGQIKLAGNELVMKDKILEADGTAIYLKAYREAEKEAAYHLVRLLRSPGNTYNIERELEAVLAKSKMTLAQKQEEAVRMVFRSQVSIITGGPGKGKTTILKIILQIFERLEKNKSVLLCAPTGRARKRLSESTGYPAFTIHKALYVTDDEMDNMEPEILEEDLIIADEFTMSDMKLASMLFSRIKTGARLILVGDADQLPSVGPGDVFRELIVSDVIPVTVLDEFFRQAKGSNIIWNADLMNRNQKNLLYGDDFTFTYVEDAYDAAEKISEIYQEELEKNGGDLNMVQVLSPLRAKTEAGVTALNNRLQGIANPFAVDKAEWETKYGLFRVGDRVMQTHNTEEIANGDIGRVVQIGKSKAGEMEMTVDFGDVIKTYQEDELSILELAYATSIHKSQGAEFPIVIIPVLTCFWPMLKRNIYYTGVTRAEFRVHLVGSKKALYMAISNSDIGKRNTLLAVRLRAEAQRQGLIPGQEAA